MIQAPIFHVNGDDPEAVVFAAKVATEFRQQFHKAVVIDMFCYRRFGHNEGDEPAFTQPLMYKKIQAHPTTLRNLCREADRRRRRHRRRSRQDEGRAGARASRPNSKPARATSRTRPTGSTAAGPGCKVAGRGDDRRGDTGVAIAELSEIGIALTAVPEGFNVHRTIQRLLEARRKMIETGEGIDWATAEALAFGTLLDEGHPVRLSGQDCERGTFSQRHAVLIDQETEKPLRAAQPHPRRPGALRGHQFDALGRGRARLRIWLFARRAERAGAVGGAVRRFRQRRAGGDRPVHLVGRAQMAAHVGPRLPVAARL